MSDHAKESVKDECGCMTPAFVEGGEFQSRSGGDGAVVGISSRSTPDVPCVSHGTGDEGAFVFVSENVFESFGLLEHILSFLDASSDLLSATCVSRRWKRAGRADNLWKAAIARLWSHKSGVYPEFPIFWRSLFTKDAVHRMSVSQIRQLFQHPLLAEKRQLLEGHTDSNSEQMTDSTFVNGAFGKWKTGNHNGPDDDKKCGKDESNAGTGNQVVSDDVSSGIRNKRDLQRFLQVHMLDVMSDNSDDGPGWHHFFSDIYFGSYACSVRDAERSVITPLELCSPHGFDMYFKIAAHEVDEDDRSFLIPYEQDDGITSPATENILLYHHSTCYFEDGRDFSIVLKQHIQSTYPTDLKWRWLDVGRRVQVGPYPHLVVIRQKNWGWKLENGHVVLLFRDKS